MKAPQISFIIVVTLCCYVEAAADPKQEIDCWDYSISLDEAAACDIKPSYKALCEFTIHIFNKKLNESIPCKIDRENCPHIASVQQIARFNNLLLARCRLTGSRGDNILIFDLTQKKFIHEIWCFEPVISNKHDKIAFINPRAHFSYVEERSEVVSIVDLNSKDLKPIPVFPEENARSGAAMILIEDENKQNRMEATILLWTPDDSGLAFFAKRGIQWKNIDLVFVDLRSGIKKGGIYRKRINISPLVKAAIKVDDWPDFSINFASIENEFDFYENYEVEWYGNGQLKVRLEPDERWKSEIIYLRPPFPKGYDYQWKKSKETHACPNRK